MLHTYVCKPCRECYCITYVLTVFYSSIMRSLGEAGLVEGETEGLLIDNDIDYEEFSTEVEDCLPKDLPWTIPEASQQRSILTCA